MDQTLLTLPLKAKRDALLARQRARQLAALLGYDFQEQTCIAAGVFAIAWQVLDLGSPVDLCFGLSRDTFQVFARVNRDRSAKKTPHQAELQVMRLEKRVPERTKLAPEDLAWTVSQLDRLTPARMYEEVCRLNQELLVTLHSLQVCQNQLKVQGEKPSAA